MNGSLVLLGAWFAVVVSISGFAYWASVKISDAVQSLAEAVDLLAEDREFSREASDDAHNAVKILRDWWAGAVLIDQPDPLPPTQPHLPPTMPQERAAGRIDDVTLAWELARLEQIMRGDLKPTPYKRTGSTASRKAS